MSDIDEKLRLIADEIDLTETEFLAVQSAYKKVGNWLSSPDSATQKYDFLIYPQGSVKIGTVIKPLAKDDYDVDIVCLFQKNYSNLSRKEVKQIVGQRLLENSGYRKMAEKEHGRCWTLNFNTSPKLHMDILPATPGEDDGDSVNATKKDDNGNYSTLPTNPKGFADWFLFNANKYQRPKIMTDSFKEPVPTYPKKSPLQMAVQLVKRHRDNYFLRYPNKTAPASIIINTLMAKTYNGQESLKEILTTCPIHWMEEINGSAGHYYLENPSLPKENFMDKWNNDDVDAPGCFFEWYGSLIRDIGHLVLANNAQAENSILENMFWKGSVEKVLNSKPRLLLDADGASSLHNSRVTDTSAFAQCDNLPMPYCPDPNVTITVSVLAENNDGRTISSFGLSSPLLPKNAELFFKAYIKGAHYFDPKVMWQITNTGKEAGSNVRGHFENPNASFNFQREEHTSYQGTHFVQAFVIRDGRCVAKSGLILINS